MDPHERRSRTTVVKFAPHLGTASWKYEAMPKMVDMKEMVGEFEPSAVAEMTVSSIALEKEERVKVCFHHMFVSAYLTSKEDAELLLELSDALKAVGAVDIKVRVEKHTPAVQTLHVEYEILDVPLPKIDELTTPISELCALVTDRLADIKRMV